MPGRRPTERGRPGFDRALTGRAVIAPDTSPSARRIVRACGAAPSAGAAPDQIRCGLSPLSFLGALGRVSFVPAVFGVVMLPMNVGCVRACVAASKPEA